MIGDVLTSSIMFEALKKKYPDSELHYVINSHTYPVVERNPFIDKFIFVTPEIENSLLKFYSFLKSIKKEKYDTVIDVYGCLSSNLITYFSKSKIRISYHKKNTSFLYTNSIKRLIHPEKNNCLAIENRMRLLLPLKIAFKNIAPKIYLQQHELDSAKIVLESFNISLSKPLFMISVLGSKPSKTYPPKYMAQLIDEIILEKPNAQILFNYIPNQKVEAREIYNLCTSKTRENLFFDVYAKSLRESLGIISHCNAIIGNEGGAINIGKALNIPSFCIFSPHIGKQNWFCKKENSIDVAVHISDFLNFTKIDKAKSKKQYNAYYLKMKPEYIIPELQKFLKKL